MSGQGRHSSITAPQNHGGGDAVFRHDMAAMDARRGGVAAQNQCNSGRHISRDSVVSVFQQARIGVLSIGVPLLTQI
jgi:hypothetical protein